MNISIELMKEIINFGSNNYHQEISIINSYQYDIEEVDFDKFDELYTRIIKIKGDWISLDYRMVDECLKVKYCLIFHNKDLSEDDKLIIEKVDNCIKEYFNDYQMVSSKNQISSCRSRGIENQEGFLISIEADGGVGYISKKEIEKVFNKNKIPFQVISERKSQFDGGASGGSEAIVFFILSSISSGLTWDFIKTVLSMNLSQPLEYFKIGFIDNFKFNNMRRTIASRINKDYSSLDLYELYKYEDEIILEFRTKNKRIKVLSDLNYMIKELKIIENVV